MFKQQVSCPKKQIRLSSLVCLLIFDSFILRLLVSCRIWGSQYSPKDLLFTSSLCIFFKVLMKNNFEKFDKIKRKNILKKLLKIMTPKLYLDLSYKQHLEDKLFEGVLYLSSKIFFDKSVLRFSIFNSQFLST